MLIQGLTHIPDREERELRRGEQVRARMTLLRQATIAEACKSIQYHHINGIGERTLVPLDPDLVWRLREKFGICCLHDPEFRKSLWKKNPGLRANCRSPKMTFRVDGLRRRNAECGIRNAEFSDGRQNKSGAGQRAMCAQGEPATGFAPALEATPRFVPHETAATGAALVLP